MGRPSEKIYGVSLRRKKETHKKRGARMGSPFDFETPLYGPQLKTNCGKSFSSSIELLQV